MKRRVSIAALSFPIGWVILAFVFLALSGGAGAAVWALGPESAMGMDVGAADESLLEDILPQMENFTQPDGPKYAGNFASNKRVAGDELTVVSYNLRYGEAIAETIRALREAAPLPAADIVLLQEMDEVGVATIASELGFNYVYYPASVAEDGDNFGNAILSRWPITQPAKLILPGLHPLTGQQRTATRAIVTVGEMDILVYSTHAEVATAPPAYRATQFAAILDDIPADADRVIVGGDFNTVTENGVDALAGLFADAGFAHDSADLGPTFIRYGVRLSATDHLFSRGFESLDAGVLADINASDHFPVWVRLAFP